MLEDLVTKEQREVDVVLESRVAGSTILIGVECRNHRRPADTPWVEAMAKKHEHLPTNKLILWSASGFYAPAVAKAKFLKIDVVSQHDAVNTSWKAIARELLSGFVRVLKPSFEFVVDVRNSRRTSGAGS